MKYISCPICNNNGANCNVCRCDEYKSNVVVTCVYCGMIYPDGTPTHQHTLLTDHIKVCEKHPLREAENKIKYLMYALERITGSEVYSIFPSEGTVFEDMAKDTWSKRVKFLQIIAQNTLEQVKK